MEKEPKKSDSSTMENTEDDMTPHPASRPDAADAALEPEGTSAKHCRLGPIKTLLEEIKATVFSGHGYLELDYFTLFWLFISGSIIGLGLETLYHAIVFGGLESRAGLLWGPFSPIYGVGAVVLTIFLNRYYHSHNLVVFLVAMVIGSTIEYIVSWGMEILWGAIAWDYTGTFGSIQGRTNFFFGMMWGMLGLVWVRIIMPVVKKAFLHIDSHNTLARTLTVFMSIFIAVNIVFTCLALCRGKERADGIPASDPIQAFFDEAYPDSYLDARFENMTIIGTDGSAPGQTISTSLIAEFSG